MKGMKGPRKKRSGRTDVERLAPTWPALPGWPLAAPGLLDAVVAERAAERGVLAADAGLREGAARGLHDTVVPFVDTSCAQNGTENGTENLVALLVTASIVIADLSLEEHAVPGAHLIGLDGVDGQGGHDGQDGHPPSRLSGRWWCR